VEFDLNRIVQLAYETKLSWLIDSIDHFHLFSKNRDRQALSRLATSFPATAALKSGLHSFVLIDDFHHIASLTDPADLALLTHDFLLALESRKAPHCLAGASRPLFQALFQTAEFPGNFEVLPLAPLKFREALTLLEGLCRRFEVQFDPTLAWFIDQQLDCNPFYMRCLVQAARRDSVGFRSARQFADLYSRELTLGNLQLYFSSLIQSASLTALERIKALELLHLCARAPLDFSAFHYLKSRSTEEVIDLERILNALGGLRLIDYGLGVVISIQDSVLKDWILWNFSHEVGGLELPRATFNLSSALLKKFEQSQQARQQSEMMEQVRDVMGWMHCQSVSQIFFDHAQFALFEAIEDPFEQELFLKRQSETVLPEIVFVTLRKSAPGLSESAGSLLAIGRGFEGGVYSNQTEVGWIAGCANGATIGLNEIQQFYQQCEAVRREADLNRVKLWLVAEGRFNQAALSFAGVHGILTSNRQQLMKLQQLIAGDAPQILEPRDHEELVIYELTIPMSPDTELVAVRAVEQVAESINFDEKSKAQIRVALTEACINVKEAATGKWKRMHVTFKAANDRLIIQMRTEAFSTEGDPAKAWGLKVLQTLMDDVCLNPTDQGFEVTITKYLGNAQKEAI
jgi:anti-sigma regulatory factor (Ser/Thr protein kinase)